MSPSSSRRRTTRSDAFVDGPRVLKVTGECRRVLIEGLTRAKVGSPRHYSMSTVVAAIDGLARMLTREAADKEARRILKAFPILTVHVTDAEEDTVKVLGVMHEPDEPDAT